MTIDYKLKIKMYNWDLLQIKWIDTYILAYNIILLLMMIITIMWFDVSQSTLFEWMQLSLAAK